MFQRLCRVSERRSGEKRHRNVAKSVPGGGKVRGRYTNIRNRCVLSFGEGLGRESTRFLIWKNMNVSKKLELIGKEGVVV